MKARIKSNVSLHKFDIGTEVWIKRKSINDIDGEPMYLVEQKINQVKIRAMVIRKEDLEIIK